MGKIDSGLMAVIGAFVAYFGYSAYSQQGLDPAVSVLLLAFGALMFLFGAYSLMVSGKPAVKAKPHAGIYKAVRAKPKKAGEIPLQGTIEKIVDKLTSQTLLTIVLGLILLFVLALYSKSTEHVVIAITLILLAVILKAKDFREGH
jgi:hypothetical protein